MPAWSRPKYNSEYGLTRRQAQRKEVPYTITPIGGTAELAAWKTERSKLDQPNEAKYESARQRAIAAFQRPMTDWRVLIKLPPPPKPFLTRLKLAVTGWIAKVWRNAFDGS